MPRGVDPEAAATQRHPTDQLLELRLVEVCKNVY